MKRLVTKKNLFRLSVIFLCLCLAGMGLIGGLNARVKHVAAGRILSAQEASALDEVDCILVMGCLVRDNGEPSDVLADRLTAGIALYESGAAPKLLMSGDHGQEDYDEVNAMKRFAVNAGVPSEDIFMDHAGFSTYESLYRAKEIFGAQKILIVTQQYHLYRALYIAERLGLEAYGVASDYRTYRGQWVRNIREVLARCKDVVTTTVKSKPTYLGEPIDLSGDGNVTND